VAKKSVLKPESGTDRHGISGNRIRNLAYTVIQERVSAPAIAILQRIFSEFVANATRSAERIAASEHQGREGTRRIRAIHVFSAENHPATFLPHIDLVVAKPISAAAHGRTPVKSRGTGTRVSGSPVRRNASPAKKKSPSPAKRASASNKASPIKAGRRSVRIQNRGPFTRANR
jgi:histone H3/H4